MKRLQALLLLSLGLTVVGAGCFTQTVNVPVNKSSTNVAVVARKCPLITSRCLRYSGQDGQTAMALLESKHKIEQSKEGFVEGIDGIKPGVREFWSFYVDGLEATVGAKEYQTKNNQTIEWRIEKF